METIQEQALETREERELRKGHYRTLTQALSYAMDLCLTWQTMDGSHQFGIADLYEFAKVQDQEHPLGEHEFYMVSSEGAIGKCPGFEWLTQWVLIPMEQEEETPPPPPPAPSIPPVSPAEPRFCTNCGAQLLPNAAFCTNCGTRVG